MVKPNSTKALADLDARIKAAAARNGVTLRNPKPITGDYAVPYGFETARRASGYNALEIVISVPHLRSVARIGITLKTRK